MTESTANQKIARAAGTVMFAILLGQITGLVRGMIVASTFGASPELDAFSAANRVSETLILISCGRRAWLRFYSDVYWIARQG